MNEYLQSSGIVDVRVDDRMVHGIVATMWIQRITAPGSWLSTKMLPTTRGFAAL